MTLLKICPTCYQGYQDISQNYCTRDGSGLSQPFAFDLPELESEIETVLRPAKVTIDNSAASTIDRPLEMPGTRRLRTNAKPFLARHFPDLLKYKRRTSRAWERSENPAYNDCWWLNFLESDLDSSEYIVFAGALDKDNVNFRVLKIPTNYIRENLSRLDMTEDGWINIYIHMDELVDTRNEARVSFGQFAVN